MVNNKNLVLCLSYELSRYLINQLEQYIDHYLKINGDDEESMNIQVTRLVKLISDKYCEETQGNSITISYDEILRALDEENERLTQVAKDE